MIPSIARLRTAALAASIAATLAPAPAAQPNPPAQPSAPIASAPLLSEAEIVVVIDGLATLRTTRAGRTIEAAAQDARLLAATTEAWSELANTLDLDNDAALDALLGRRAILAIDQPRSEDGDGTATRTRWALVSEVSRATEDRLRRRLRPVPRAMIAGRALLALERGAYEATSITRDRETSILALAPAGNRDWLTSVITALDTAPRAAVPPGVRLEVRDGASLAWSGRAALEPTPAGLRLRLVDHNAREPRPTALASDPTALAASDRHRSQPLGVFIDGGSLGMLDRLLSRAEPSIGTFATSVLRERATGEFGLIAWPAERSASPALEPHLDPQVDPQIDLALAFAVTDPEGTIAGLDAAMETLADTLSQEPRLFAAFEGFAGAFPTAERAIRLPVAPNAGPLAEPVTSTRIAPGRATLAWRMTTDFAGEPWCIVAASRTDAAAHDRLDDLANWLSRPTLVSRARDGWGHVAGAQLAAALDSAHAPAVATQTSSPLELLRLVDHAEWTTFGGSLTIEADFHETAP